LIESDKNGETENLLEIKEENFQQLNNAFSIDRYCTRRVLGVEVKLGFF
jgi:DNA-directed RNA polymerase subunit N (RpoN/RPB10)